VAPEVLQKAHMVVACKGVTSSRMTNPSTRSKVTFCDEEDEIFEIPTIPAAEVPRLFYSTDEISTMKEAAFLEMSGLAESVSSSGTNLFEVEVEGALHGGPDSRPGIFRQESLQKVSRVELSPVRTSGRCSPGESQDASNPVKQPKRERPRREPGAARRSRSNAEPLRTDGKSPVGSSVSPRRMQSTMASREEMAVAPAL